MYGSKHEPCSLWKEKLSTSCLDKLPRGEWAAFKLHAASCQACHAVMVDYFAVDSRIREALLPRQSLGLWKAFLSFPSHPDTKQHLTNNQESSTGYETLDNTT